MARDLLPTAGIVALGVTLVAGAAQLQAVRERAFPPSPDVEDAVIVRSGTAIRRMSGAYSALSADLYWIRAIQYYGGTKRRLAAGPQAPEPPAMLAAVDNPEYSQLYPMLDITTSLDPRFKIAYRFGAVFLAEPFPRGAGRPDLAIALLEKGIAADPDSWEYMQDAGFVRYWYNRDFRAAAGWFDRASRVPGAPWWLRSLAATTTAQGGDRQSSRMMWEAIRQSADVDWLKQDAERRLMQLHALDDIDGLQRAVDRYRAGAGASPEGWVAMVRARIIPGLPLDPSRTPYELAADGRVRLSTQSPLWPLPEEPPAVDGSAPR